MPKRALITGITGQDGSYLAELLLDKGYEVHGIIRRASTFNTHRLDHLYVDPHEPDARLFLHYGDLTDGTRLVTLLTKVQPDEVYHLAAQTHVRVSFDEPEYTGLTTGLGTTRLLEAIRATGLATRFYQASSSEMFGATPPPQDESDAVSPAVAVRRGEGLRLLDGTQLPRGLRAVCLQRDPVQPRVTPTRRDVRHPQDHPRGSRDRRRPAGAISTSATSTRCATGDMRRSTSTRCGRCCNRTSPMTSSSRPAAPYSVRDFVQFAFDHAGLDWEKLREFRRPLPAAVRGRRARRRREQGGGTLGWTAKVLTPELARIMVDADRARSKQVASSAASRTGWARLAGGPQRCGARTESATT